MSQHTGEPGDDGTSRSQAGRNIGTDRRSFLAASGSAAAVAAAGCLGSSSNGTETVTFGTLPIAAVAEVFVADERGYFEERDIELEIERIQGLGSAVPSLATGEYDIATGSLSGGVVNAIAGGQPIQVIADQTQYWDDQPSANRFWVREGLYTEGMSITDLPDEFTYAVNGQGTSINYLLGRLVQRADLDIDDIEITQMPFPEMVGAMDRGEIDVCSIPDPLGLSMPGEAGAGQLLYGSQLAPEMQVGVYAAGAQFLENRPEVARQWLEAYLLGVREYYEQGGYQNEEIAEIISAEIEIPAPAIRSSVPSLPHKNGRVNAASLMTMQEYYQCRGFADETVAESELINEGPLEDALAEVGELDQPEPSVGTISEWRETAPNKWPEVGESIPPANFPSADLCE